MKKGINILDIQGLSLDAGSGEHVRHDHPTTHILVLMVATTGFRLSRSTSLRRKQNKRFVEFETFGNSFRKVCNFQSVVSLRQIGTFSFNFSHQKQNVRKYWSPMALHCFFSIFSRDFQLLRPFFSETLGSKKLKKQLFII